MREEDLRRVLLVRAVEEADRDGTLLPPAERAAAGREAMREAGSADPERLLAARARTLLARIVARHPFVDRILGMLGPPTRLTLVLAAAGIAFGAALSALDGSRRINVLAFPLVGIVAWNLVVYLAVAASVLRRGPLGETPIRAALASTRTWMAERAIERSRAYNAALAEALRAFAREWFDAEHRLLVTRASRALHLAAAAVGAGLVAGLYVRGLAFDYRAGWESTFLDASQARDLLDFLYGPASWLTGIPVPEADELAAAQWSGDEGGGEPAARWIHLIAATALLYVIGPRLLLALQSHWRAVRLAARAPQPPGMPGYFRAAFAGVEGAVPRAAALVMPYACELSPGALAGLVAWVEEMAAGPVDVSARASVPYGEEEAYLAALDERGGATADVVVLPFSLAATPEAENHGRILSGARDRLASRPGARILVVVDEAPYAARMASAPERVEERRRAWASFVRAHGLEASFVRLEEAGTPA